MWYVIQTLTGKEEELVSVIRKLVPRKFYTACFFFERQLLKRLGGEWLEVTETLFPAYVFLETGYPQEMFFELKRVPEFTKLLGDNRLQDYGRAMFIPLYAGEEAFLRKLCGYGAKKGAAGDRFCIRLTTIRLDGAGAITGIDGPLEAFQDRIEKYNFRKRYAVVDLPGRGRKWTAVLGIRMERDEGGNT